MSSNLFANWNNDYSSVTFQNSARLSLTNGSLTYITSEGQPVQLHGTNFKLVVPEQGPKTAVIVEHTDITTTKVMRFIFFENGYVRFAPINSLDIEKWSLRTFTFQNSLYCVISTRKQTQKSNSIMIVRATDGHRITTQTQDYADLFSTFFKPSAFNIDLISFSKNPGFSSFFPDFDTTLFQGSDDNILFKKISAPNSQTLLLPHLTDPSSPNYSQSNNSIANGLRLLLAQGQSETELINKLKSKIFGQDHLIEILATQSYVVDDHNSTKPNVVMITGPSGVGKSYLAEQLALEKLKDPSYYLEIDGTKYAGGDSKDGAVLVHKLLGAEKAWQGQQKGELTEFLKRTGGRGVIVINEGDKMNPFVYTKLMEFFDKGVVTSGEGEVISGKQTMVVITSNRGARQLIPEQAKNWSDAELNRYLAGLTSEQIKQVFLQKQSGDDKNTFLEEISNRISIYAVAGPLTKQALNKIFKAAVTKDNQALEKKYKGLRFNFSDAALDYLADVNTDLFSHGRMMKQRSEFIFNSLTKSIQNALQSGKWKPDDVNSIDISLYKNKKQKYFFLINKDIQVEVPQPVNPNPLADPLIRNIIVNLNSNLKKRVIGQDAMIHNIEQLVVNHLAQGVRFIPTVFMTIGTTGTGKTETGLAIAESVYGSKDRAGIIDMGEILSSYHFHLKFEKGLEDSESEFERFLRNNPDGGVLILDEASNMGGQNQETKNELFKKLYAIFDRGTWRSPVTGKEYDLTKYMIQLTGNDGQHFFAGSSADEDRLEIWKKVNNEETLHEMLVQSGIPEALLARLSSIILTKPLLRQELKPIAEKLLIQKIKPIEQQYKGLKINYDSSILDVLADSFFSHSKGVRAIRETIDKRFGYAIHSALLASGLPLDNLSGVQISLKIDDNKSLKPYIDDSSADRKVNLSILINKKRRSKKGDFYFEKQIDLTEYAQPQVLDKYHEAWLTAIHEAAHAVVNDPESTGEKVSFITIKGGTFGFGPNKIIYKGYARTKPFDSKSPTRDIIVKQLARIAAGNVAELLAGHPSTAGWENDLKKMKELGTKALINFGFDQQFLGVRLDKDGNPIMSQNKLEQFEIALEALIQEGIESAHSTLTKNWDYVISVAKTLMKEGEINGNQFEKLRSKSKKEPLEKASLRSHKSLLCYGFYSH